MPALLTQLGDPRIADWMAAIPQPFDTSQARAFLTFAEDDSQKVRAVEINGTVIGGLCVGDSLWYWLAPYYWGRGLINTVLRAALTDHFAGPASPLIATSREDNSASIAVLRRLGFSPRPETRRMFFHSAGTSLLCRDHVMTPEQWHILNPPHLRGTQFTLRPARQADLATVQRLLEGSGRDNTWPASSERHVRRFLETHRYRGMGPALWIIENEERRALGVAISGTGVPVARFSQPGDCDRLLPEVLTLLEDFGTCVR